MELDSSLSREMPNGIMWEEKRGVMVAKWVQKGKSDA